MPWGRPGSSRQCWLRPTAPPALMRGAFIAGRDASILVLDGKEVNVRCAAGQGTCGMQELVTRVAAVNLRQAVAHRTLMLPQLAASGVAAHEGTACGDLWVEHQPVCVLDLPHHLETG